MRNTSVGCLLSSPNRPLDRISNFIFENFRLLLFSHASKHVSCFDEILVFIFRRIGQQSVCWMTRLPPLFGYQRAGNSLIRDISARFFLVVFFFGRAACSLRETPSFAFGPLHLRWHLHTNKPVAGKSDSDAASTLLIYLLIIYLTSWSDMRPTRRRVSHWRMRLTRNSIKSSKYRQSIFGLLFPKKKQKSGRTLSPLNVIDWKSPLAAPKWPRRMVSAGWRRLFIIISIRFHHVIGSEPILLRPASWRPVAMNGQPSLIAREREGVDHFVPIIYLFVFFHGEKWASFFCAHQTTQRGQQPRGRWIFWKKIEKKNEWDKDQKKQLQQAASHPPRPVIGDRISALLA